MSYSQWLDTLVSPIQYFINWLIAIADSLIHNYIFITFLGITLFISLVWFIFHLIFDFIDSINDRYDDYNDKYYNYELLKEVQSDYLDKHYIDEYDYRYRSKVLNGQVLNGYLQQNKDLDIDNKRLANLNKIEALKDIKQEKLTDDDSSNDDDIDLIIPPKPQLANKNELGHSWLYDYDDELKNEINSNVDNILYENGYIDYKGHLFDIKTGEVVDSNVLSHVQNTTDFLGYSNSNSPYIINPQYAKQIDDSSSIVLSTEEKNRILQKDFEDYNLIDTIENDFNRESKSTFNDEFYGGEYK